MSTYAERRDRLVGELSDARGGSLGLAKDTSNLFRNRAATGKRFARYWLHNNMIERDGRTWHDDAMSNG